MCDRLFFCLSSITHTSWILIGSTWLKFTLTKQPQFPLSSTVLFSSLADQCWFPAGPAVIPPRHGRPALVRIPPATPVSSLAQPFSFHPWLIYPWFSSSIFLASSAVVVFFLSQHVCVFLTPLISKMAYNSFHSAHAYLAMCTRFENMYIK